MLRTGIWGSLPSPTGCGTQKQTWVPSLRKMASPCTCLLPIRWIVTLDIPVLLLDMVFFCRLRLLALMLQGHIRVLGMQGGVFFFWISWPGMLIFPLICWDSSFSSNSLQLFILVEEDYITYSDCPLLFSSQCINAFCVAEQ